MTTTNTNPTSRAAAPTSSATAARSPVTLSTTDLVAMAAVGMEGYDTQVAQKTAAQRKDTNALKVLGELKAKMQKYQNGLDNSDDGDSKRAGGDADRGKAMRSREFVQLRAAFEEACQRLPPEYAAAAQTCLDTMSEKGMWQFDANQASTMSESIEAKISDITTRSQAAMAEINNLVSQRSNMVEMTKNITTALSSQQESIARNAPR